MTLIKALYGNSCAEIGRHRELSAVSKLRWHTFTHAISYRCTLDYAKIKE